MRWVAFAFVLFLVLAGCLGKGPQSASPISDGQRFHVQVRLVDDATGAPVAGLWRAELGEAVVAGGLAPDGASLLTVPSGALEVHATAECRPEASARVDVAAHTQVEVRFGPITAESAGAPAVTVHAGPGAMTTLVWDAIAGARGYEVVEGGRTYDVGGSLAWGDHTPSGSYGVRAVRCGVAGAVTQVQADVPLLPPLPTLAVPVPAAVDVSEEAYATFNATGAPGPTQAWRVVQGTGNCCENYLATTRQGWIVDFGGDSVLVSKDEGVSWEIVTPHGYQGCGEGAIVPGPGGDLYAMNWEMCAGGAGNDQVWGLKYVAADDAWLDGVAPAHSPFFDRPWMSVSPGPHVAPDGTVWPVRSYIFSNFNDNLYGAGHVVSGDGRLYHVDAPLVDTVGGDPYTLPGALPFDADADWSQPYVGTFGRSLAPGLHVFRTGLLPCMLVDTPGGRACANRDLPLDSMQRDAGGRLHAVESDDGNITYRWSDDVGLTLPDGRIVLSFTDGEIHPPAVAIELPAAG